MHGLMCLLQWFALITTFRCVLICLSNPYRNVLICLFNPRWPIGLCLRLLQFFEVPAYCVPDVCCSCHFFDCFVVSASVCVCMSAASWTFFCISRALLHFACSIFFIFRASFSLTTLFSQRILINGREISSFSFSQGKMGIPWRNWVPKIALVRYLHVFASSVNLHTKG